MELSLRADARVGHAAADEVEDVLLLPHLGIRVVAEPVVALAAGDARLPAAQALRGRVLE